MATSVIASPADTTEVDAEVQLAAAIARGVRAHPDMTDSILSANMVTIDGVEEMMYRISADSARSAAYQRLTGG
jgi:hypothetical protein